SAQFEVQFNCESATDLAKVTTWVSQAGVDLGQKTDAVEVRSARPTTTPPPTTQRSELEGVISSSANPAQAGQPATLNLAITNRSGAAMTGVQYRLVFEPSKIQPTVPAGARRNENV